MKAANLISLIIVLILGYQDSTSGHTSSIPLISELNKTEKPITTLKKPTNRVNFTPELTIKPFSVLLDWLNHQVKTTSGSRKQLRLPVVIRFKDSYRLAIGNAFVGTSDTDLDKDAIFLSLDDTSMGISLLSRLRNICPKNSNSCGVWLEGYWGSLLELDLPDHPLPGENKAEVSKWPFTVLKVHELIKQPEQGEQIRVFIESSSL
ncbi:hypothetical protein Cylst_3402 [Cylindrospermum stagnale PCC 7417]|uniref:Uncharacterized protein n=1 Tax=Cylindrospermum stagnale PCC 7417 TaxID=56107 RepID=K9X1D1_9NOST|nr:hypothetical protein [Cylindrospermum stagnale]AFZ25552.1 hypothetical protein Cylst_3402 [Cylindrospermum stagnale PCC 7417]